MFLFFGGHTCPDKSKAALLTSQDRSKRKSVVYCEKYHCTISIPRTIIYMHSTDTKLYNHGRNYLAIISLFHIEYGRPYILSRNNFVHPLERISSCSRAQVQDDPTQASSPTSRGRWNKYLESAFHLPQKL